MNKYDIFFPQEPERKSEWIQRRLFFEDPLYNINYLYAILVACKFYDIAHRDPQKFADNYNKLLRNGFNDTVDKTQ
jgi:oligoendopeptidase F